MPESLRIFLVEDDDNMALLLRLALERAGHQVTACRTAADALIVLSQGDYHLVILDHVLPDLKGLDLLQSLKHEGIAAPVLFITGMEDQMLAAEVLRAGALDYLVKDQALVFLAELPKRVEEAVIRHRLQDMNRLLIEALESAGDGIAITDLQGTFLHVNKALERLSGYDRVELLGQNVRLFKSGAHSSAYYADIWRMILSRRSWQGELINRRKDGSLLDVALTISPIVDGRGALTHFVALYRDIGDRKLLERQLLQAQKMQSVGTLAGGIAHEFNNLLAGIQGYASLGLRETGQSNTVREFLQNIVDLSDRAANLTRALLAYARKPALSRQPTSLTHLLQQTAELVRHTLSVEVVLDVPSGEGEQYNALADANQLQQVLVNLALNARDAMEEKKPIQFRLRPTTVEHEFPSFPENVPAGDYLLLQVEDHGQGMSPVVLNQALDPFFTTKDVGQGTGLGLPVALGIVHGHHGFLGIDTALGEGTTVSLYLPRLLAPSPEKNQTLEPGQMLEPESVQGRDILVIDDEEAVLYVVRRFLEIAGHNVTCVTTGTSALDYLAKGLPVDLVILDLMIPREDGDTTFQRLRQHRPSLPILLCTGLLQSDPAPRLLEEPSVGILRKPFRMNELWYAVNQALAVVE